MTARRVHGQGSIQPRGKNSWRIRYRIGGAQHAETFRGLKSAAQKRLTDLLAAGNRGEHVAPSRVTVSEFIERWLTTWVPANVSATTAETYRFHAKNLQRHLYGVALQKLAPVHLAELYAALLKEGLSPRTVGHAHRVLHGALERAVSWQLLPNNPASKVSPPRVPEKEIETLRPEQLQVVLAAIRKMPTRWPLACGAVSCWGCAGAISTSTRRRLESNGRWSRPSPAVWRSSSPRQGAVAGRYRFRRLRSH
jgi:hypothetical protein